MMTLNNDDKDNDGEKYKKDFTRRNQMKGGGERHYGLPQQKKRKSPSK